MKLNFLCPKSCLAILKKYFPPQVKLFDVSKDTVERLADLYSHDSPILFNNRTWIQLWESVDYVHNGSIKQQIDDSEPALWATVKRTQHNKFFNNESDFFIFYIKEFTGFFYIAAVMEAINQNSESGVFTIVSYLDPYEQINDYGFYGRRMKPQVDFNKLIESYNETQLYILSELFMYLQNVVEISEIGIKFWKYIYEKGIDEKIEV